MTGTVTISVLWRRFPVGMITAIEGNRVKRLTEG